MIECNASGVAVVAAVGGSPKHEFSKHVQTSIRLMARHGVEGDAHAGITVQHRSRVRVDPTQLNLRQIHLIGAELHRTLAASGFPVAPGALAKTSPRKASICTCFLPELYCALGRTPSSS